MTETDMILNLVNRQEKEMIARGISKSHGCQDPEYMIAGELKEECLGSARKLTLLMMCNLCGLTRNVTTMAGTHEEFAKAYSDAMETEEWGHMERQEQEVM